MKKGEGMNKEFIRFSLLTALIILCTWQTTLLWLGESPSHHFLNETTSEIVTQPREIWVSNNGLAYKIDGDNDGSRLGLIAELINEIKKGNYHVLDEDKYTYAQLLTRQGLVYEYGTSLSIEEILGFPLNKEANKKEIGKVASLFIDVSEGDRYKSDIYFIGEHQEIIKKLTLEVRLELHSKTLEHYNDEDKIEGIKTYQASLLHMDYSKAFLQNVFYPLNNQNRPIIYKSLKWEPMVTGDTKEEVALNLEEYVNAFFKNPLYKEWTILDHAIVFSDSLNMNVRYSDVGVMEFQKVASGEAVKLSPLEKLSKVNTFIATSPAISSQLKKGLYLKRIVEKSEDEETIYQFGYRYEGFEVLLTQEAKKQLKINEFLELVVKNNEIIRGKWLMLDLVEKEDARYKEFSKEGKMAIEEIKALCGISDLEESPLGYLECAYQIEDIAKPLSFNWAALYKGKWYFP